MNDIDGSPLLIDMVQGYFRGKVLCAAVRLGIADALADGDKSLDQLANLTDSHAESLYRLLRALASIGIIEEVSAMRFKLAPIGEPLKKDAPNSVWASIIFWGDLIADFWTYLPECIRTGAAANFVMEQEGVTSRWSKEPQATEIFHLVFAEPGIDEMAATASAYDFSACQIVADLGGAGGGLLASVMVAVPHVRGILVDRQEAIDRAAIRFQTEGLMGRCQLVPGDLLESVPRGADAYILSHVLHGYPDADARRILDNCRTAMSSKSRLLIIENVLPTAIDTVDPDLEKMLMSDLNMLQVTGGRERSRDAWISLLASASLKLNRILPIPSTTRSIIEAEPDIKQ